MDPLLRAGILVSVVAALTRAAELPGQNGGPKTAPAPLARAPAASFDSEAPCPAGTLPDAEVCIPVPEQAATGPAQVEQQNFHHDRLGRWVTYEQIPRRPERTADYRKYRLPIPMLEGQAFVGSGYDLDRPDREQRRGPELRAVGHGGVDLAQRRGTLVHLAELENQVGSARVQDVGELFGHTVITRHTLREAGALREYLVIYGHLEGAAPGLNRGQTLAPGALIGSVGDSGNAGSVHLHLEIRRVRSGVDAAALALSELTNNAKTVACDPRNVLSLR